MSTWGGAATTDVIQYRDRVAPAPGRDHLADPVRRVLGHLAGARHHKGRLVGRHRGQRHAVRRGPQDQRAARGMPERVHRGRSHREDSRGHHRGQVGHLEIGGVGLGVAAVTTAAPVVGVDREPLGQPGGRDERPAVTERPDRHDQRRPLAGPVVGDDGAVRGLRCLHGAILPC